MTGRTHRRVTPAGVGLVLALVGCGSETTTPAPAADPSPTGRSLVTTVPDDFPIHAGPGYRGGDSSPGRTDLYVCGPDLWPRGEVADAVGATSPAGAANLERALVLYADDEAAAAALAAVATGLAECPEQDLGLGEFVEPQPLTSSAGEDSVAYLDQYGDGNGPNGEGSAVLVTRVGNAVILDRSFLLADADDLASGQAEVDRIAADAAVVLDAMCVFSAAGCGDIPAGFGLDVGLVADRDNRVVGPAPDLDGVDLAALCAVPHWPGDDATDRLAVRATGPEYAETRELVTFTDAQAAVAATGVVQQGFAACEPGAGTAVEPLRADTGYESSLTYALTYDVGLGGEVVQLVRVGRAVLVVSSAGELLRQTVQVSADAFTARNREVTAQLCGWAEAGC